MNNPQHEMREVLAFYNGGEYHYVADDPFDLSERLSLNNGELEINADQCDNCGSFDPATGEPGKGFIVDSSFQKLAHCGCCGAGRDITWHIDNDTVFPC